MIEYPDRISIDSPFSTLPGDYWLRLSSGAACLFRVLAWPPHCKCSRPGWEVIPLLTLGGIPRAQDILVTMRSPTVKCTRQQTRRQIHGPKADEAK
jgi:hypothetical protein